MPAKKPIEPNTRFGCLTVLSEDGKLHGKPAYRVRCDCGKEHLKIRTTLRDDRVACSSSCTVRPPTNYRHGAAGDPKTFTGAYRSWLAMRQRVLDPNSKSYRHYGERGIVICDRWNDFSNFLADMGDRPEGYTLERENVNGNYEPGNCLWIPAEHQAQNRRNSHRNLKKV